MKKKTTFLLMLATLLLAIVPIEGFAYKSKLVGLSGDFSESGGVYTINNNGGNNHIKSHIEASAFSLEAKVQMLDGDKCMSFVFGSTGYDHDKWYGVELAVRDGKAHVKAFQDHGHGLMIERLGIEANVDQPIPFKINVTAEGRLTIFVEGNQVVEHDIPDYITGRLGILTWRTKAVLTDLWVDFGGEEGTKVDLEGLTGDFSTPNAYTIYRNPGRDNFVFSDTQATAFSYEGKVSVLEGDRMSLLFGVKENQGGAFAVELLKKDNEVEIKGFRFDHSDYFPMRTVQVNTSQPIPYKIEVSADGKLNIFVEGNKVNDTEIQLDGYTGGRLGLLTWDSRVIFSDVIVKVDGQEQQLTNLSGDYSSPKDVCVINRTDGNNVIFSSISAAAFSYSGKVQALEGDKCLSFVFGAMGGSRDPLYGVELYTGVDKVNVKVFHDNAGGEPVLFTKNDISANTSQPIPFKIDVTANGLLTIYVNGIQEAQYQIENYHPGKLGVLTWRTKAIISDIVVIKKDIEGTEPEGGFKTNTTGWAKDPNTNGVWTITADGLFGIGNNNSPYFSSSSAADFIFETDMRYVSGTAGGVLFRANADHSVYYTIDLMNDDRQGVRILKFYKNPETGVTSDITIGGESGNLLNKPGYVRKSEFKIRIEAIKSNINVYIDGNLVATADDSEVLEGFFGASNYSSQILFQNMYYTVLTELPLLTSLTGDVEFIPVYSNDIFRYNAFVPFTTEKIVLTPTTTSNNNLFIGDVAVASGSSFEVDLAEGENMIWVKVQDKTSEVSTITTINVKRRQNPETAYTERYRPQFHYTPEAHWVNDPNGMVYYDGEYHLFYQYHPYSKFWGPMHWGHAISKDMVYWEEYPIALYPDKFGTMFSGSAVVDVNNSSGFFTDLPEKKGLVAIYTNDGHGGQQQAIAYSLDKGRTWIKYNEGEPVLKIADDPLNHRDFRDPKVFWHDESGKWMMVIAGGPLRFYSSSNLIDWTFESGYKDNQTIDGKAVNAIHTECPDFFELPVEGGEGNKWVLTRSSETYMIGDFKEVGGKWYFFPDGNVSTSMNFGEDNYAAQTYSDTPDGRRVMVNWMTDFAYTDALANVTDPYNGAFTMAYELKLKQTSNGIKLYQTPIEEYESLRKSPYSFNNVTVAASDENILKDIKSKQFEIVAEVTPEEGNVRFGFNLRTGNGQVTKVYYNTVPNRQLIMDRTNSGTNPNGSFPKSYSRTVNRQADGKLKLHIFVDWSSIEVFANDGEAVGTLLIFPDPTSEGMEFFVEGSPVKANINVYPLKSIWREDGSSSSCQIKSNTELAAMYSNANGLNIDLRDEVDNLNVTIYDVEGRLIMSDQITGKYSRIPLKQGLYIVKLSNNEKAETKKIVIN